MDVDRPGLFPALTSCSSLVGHGKLVLGACHPSLPLGTKVVWVHGLVALLLACPQSSV